MNNLEDLKNYVDKNMENIKITEDIRSNIIKKSKEKKYYNFKYVAIIVLPMILIIPIFFNNQLGYAAKNVLRYVPGINKLLSNTDHQVYGLSGSIKLCIDEEKYIKINSAYTEGDSVILTMESNVPKYKEITAIGQHGKSAELKSYDMMKDLDNNQWSGRFNYKFDNISNRFNIVYDKYTLPVIMTELPEVSSKERNYVSIEGINIDIAVITNYVEDKLEINLLTKSNDPNKTISFPLNDIYLLDDKGKKDYCVSNNSENIIYFDRKLDPDIQLVIPYISIADESVQSKITISKDEVLPIDIKIGDNNLTINSIEWVEYVEHFNFKTEKKDYIPIEEEAQKVKLVIDKKLVETNELNLHDISVDIDKDELNEYIVEDVKLMFSDPYSENNLEATNDNYKNLVIYGVRKEQREINITFTDLVLHTNNKIIIPLQP